MVWSLALCLDDAKQDHPVVYGAESVHLHQSPCKDIKTETKNAKL